MIVDGWLTSDEIDAGLASGRGTIQRVSNKARRTDEIDIP
jgi:hypothetical protein